MNRLSFDTIAEGNMEDQPEAIIRYREVPTIRVDIERSVHPDGTAILRSRIPLQPVAFRITDRLKHWAEIAPDRIFLARKNENKVWVTLSYSQAYRQVKNIAQFLLEISINPSRPIAILSENSIEHALLSLAAMHVGLPYCPVAPAYSLRSEDFKKLSYIIDALQPSLVFVDDAYKYQKPLYAAVKGIDILAVSNVELYPGRITPFSQVLNNVSTDKVEEAHQKITPDTIAKILFTSGSTGLPKGVINTHENITVNWQQITQTFPFLAEEPLEMVDWLPWNHTFGGNHNFGLALFNGGSLYIDDGNPTPEGIRITVANLKERHPTVYFNVPKGFEILLPILNDDQRMAQNFFKNLKMIFYAGAGMPQHLWDAWESLAVQTTGEKILIGTGLGCTESCPSALFSSNRGGFASLLGVPVPGLELKLARVGDQLEARYRGRNIFPGYWRQPELSEKAFDAEGFYCTGDALRYVDEADVGQGMLFDGRLAEDFKLSTGTWVRLGPLRSDIIAAGEGLIQDVVLTGHDADFVGAIVFPSWDQSLKLTQLSKSSSRAEVVAHPLMRARLEKLLQNLASKATGSSTFIRRSVLADFEPSLDRGEITDKGTLNQKAVLLHHSDLVRQIYREPRGTNIVEIQFENCNPDLGVQY